jgi:hypothetical protein
VTEEDGFLWRLTGFYGESSMEKKYLSWKAFCTLNAARRCPWLCLGDFNEILLACEKEGVCHEAKAIWIGSEKL